MLRGNHESYAMTDSLTYRNRVIRDYDGDVWVNNFLVDWSKNKIKVLKNLIFIF